MRNASVAKVEPVASRRAVCSINDQSVIKSVGSPGGCPAEGDAETPSEISARDSKPEPINGEMRGYGTCKSKDSCQGRE